MTPTNKHQQDRKRSASCSSKSQLPRAECRSVGVDSTDPAIASKFPGPDVCAQPGTTGGAVARQPLYPQGMTAMVAAEAHSLPAVRYPIAEERPTGDCLPCGVRGRKRGGLLRRRDVIGSRRVECDLRDRTPIGPPMRMAAMKPRLLQPSLELAALLRVDLCGYLNKASILGQGHGKDAALCGWSKTVRTAASCP